MIDALLMAISGNLFRPHPVVSRLRAPGVSLVDTAEQYPIPSDRYRPCVYAAG
jgi:hypothetical protein